MNRQFSAKRPGERIALAFDFASQLPEGITITSVDSVTVSTWRGTDGNPSALLAGAAVLSGTDVLQMVSGGIAGTDYQFIAWVTLSDTQQRALDGLLPVRDNV
ncbi:MAG: hypothetical protein KDH15_15775 [Rhodocyclaceae bacterium]|nr:hypothetical protein [Rhodocyclaceae bacterium]